MIHTSAAVSPPEARLPGYSRTLIARDPLIDFSPVAKHLDLQRLAAERGIGAGLGIHRRIAGNDRDRSSRRIGSEGILHARAHERLEVGRAWVAGHVPEIVDHFI